MTMDNETSCATESEIVSSPFSFALIVLAVCILVVLSFTSQRRRLLKNGPGLCLWGYPGIVTPVNFLSQHYQPDYIYVVLFGTMSGDVFKYIIAAHSYFISPTNNVYFNVVISSVISPLLLVLYLSVKYFPLFACVDPPVKIIGHVMGTLYSIFLISYGVYEDVYISYCRANGNSVVLWLLVSTRIPVYILNLITLLWYCFLLLFDFVKFCRGGISTCINTSGTQTDSYYKYYYSYVKNMLRKTQTNLHGRLYLIVTRALKCAVPCFSSARKLPLWFLGTLIIALVVLYQLSFVLLGAIVVFYTVFSSCSELVTTLFPSWGPCSDDVSLVYSRFEVVVIASPLVSLVISVLLTVHMVAAIHNSVLNAARGDYKFSKVSPSLRVSASLKYAGYQIAFVLAGYIIYTLICLLIGILIFCMYILFKWYPDTAKHVVTYLTVPLAWVGIVFLCQAVLCKLLFVRKGGGKFLIITNQRIFHWFSYILLIYNAVLGLVAAFFRVLISSFFSLLLIMRLDRVVLMKGFESCDIGHNAYLGFLFLDYTYNNAIVQVFVKLLCDTVVVGEKSKRETALLSFREIPTKDIVDHDLAFGQSLVNEEEVVHYGASTIDQGMKHRRSSSRRQSRNRWFVAYTLIRNPSLQPLTASNLHQSDIN